MKLFKELHQSQEAKELVQELHLSEPRGRAQKHRDPYGYEEEERPMTDAEKLRASGQRAIGSSASWEEEGAVPETEIGGFHIRILGSFSSPGTLLAMNPQAVVEVNGKTYETLKQGMINIWAFALRPEMSSEEGNEFDEFMDANLDKAPVLKTSSEAEEEEYEEGGVTTLDVIREQIRKEIPHIDKKPYSHNIIGLLLSQVAKEHGTAAANALIDELGLEERGWSQVHEEMELLRGLYEAPTTRPESVMDEHLEYLDGLRESGVTNMFGAGAYLEKEFNLSQREARAILSYWMKTFGDDSR